MAVQRAPFFMVKHSSGSFSWLQTLIQFILSFSISICKPWGILKFATNMRFRIPQEKKSNTKIITINGEENNQRLRNKKAIKNAVWLYSR